MVNQNMNKVFGPPENRTSFRAKQGKTKKQNSAQKKIERINKFDDANNKYIAFFTKKIKNLNRKLMKCEKIKEKIDKNLEVQNEEMEIFNNRSKIDSSIEEYKKLLFKVKEIALDEKSEETQKKKEKEEEKKQAERSFDIRAEQLEKELNKKAKDDMEKLISQKTNEFDASIAQNKINVEENTINFILEIYYASRFVEFLPDKDLLVLLSELSFFLKKKYSEKNEGPVDEEFVYVTNDDLNYFRSFVQQIFPTGQQMNLMQFPKDEIFNSAKQIKSLLIESKDPINGLNQKYSFDRMGLIAAGIVHSRIFYNRTESALQNPLPNTALSENAISEALSVRNPVETAAESSVVEPRLQQIDVNQNNFFSIPSQVPVICPQPPDSETMRRYKEKIATETGSINAKNNTNSSQNQFKRVQVSKNLRNSANSAQNSSKNAPKTTKTQKMTQKSFKNDKNQPKNDKNTKKEKIDPKNVKNDKNDKNDSKNASFATQKNFSRGRGRKNSERNFSRQNREKSQQNFSAENGDQNETEKNSFRARNSGRGGFSARRGEMRRGRSFRGEGRRGRRGAQRGVVDKDVNRK